MDTTIEFHTFDQMVAVLARNTPHALVQDWWSRLEGVIRRYCVTRGAKWGTPIFTLIGQHLTHHPGASPDLLQEIHAMRKLRNTIAHGDAPLITADEAAAFATRAWKIGWHLLEHEDRQLAGW